MIHFEDEDANSLWKKIALHLSNTKNFTNSRLGENKELLHVSMTLNNPIQRWVYERYPGINPAFAIAEVVWLVMGRNDSIFLKYWNRQLTKFAGNKEVFHGSYGYRLKKNFQLNQLYRAYSVLKNNPDTRQVVLQIWDPRKDLPFKDGTPRDQDIPCNISSLLKIRNNRLEWLQVIRSNDFFLGLPYNLIQFTTLQEIVAGWLGIESGSYNQISDSLHIYKKDYSILSNINYESKKILNMDSLSLPYKISTYYFKLLSSLIEQIVYNRFNSSAAGKFLSDFQNESFKNLACILIAEHFRREKNTFMSKEIISMCTNPILNFLWDKWISRFGKE